jgi:hypothetical protein
MRLKPAAVVLTVLAAVALAAAGCERRTTVAGDLRDAAHSIGHAAAGVNRDQNIRVAEADLRQAGHDVTRDFHRAEAEARDAARRIAFDAHRALHDLTHRNAPDRSSD